jgi:DNA repair protein RadB
LHGGYEKDVITTIYGPAGAGKTNFCMLAAVSQAKKGNKVIFIDTEGGFSVERAKQLIGKEDLDLVLRNMMLFKPTSFKEQSETFELLVKELSQKNPIGLIVIDGIAMLYRLVLAEASQSKEYQGCE